MTPEIPQANQVPTPPAQPEQPLPTPPRSPQRWLPWIAGALLLIIISAAIVVRLVTSQSAASPATVAPLREEINITTKKLGDIQPGTYLDTVISQDGNHLATPHRLADGTQTVMLDGVAGHAFSRVTYIKFSPDGRVAHIGDDGNYQSMLVNNKEIARRPYVSRPIFSPDGTHLAYSSCTGRDGTTNRGDCYLHINDRQFGPYEYVVYEDIAFSPDSRQIAFIAVASDTKERSGTYGYTLFVYDVAQENLQEHYIRDSDNVGNTQHDLVFGADKTVAYKRPSSGATFFEPSYFISVNGKGGKEYSRIDSDSVVISPTGRVAYSAQHEPRKLVIIDGQELGPFTSLLWGPEFSPTGEVLFIASHEDENFLYREDTANPWPAGAIRFAFTPPVVSRDGEVMAYVVRNEAGRALTVNGQQTKMYPEPKCYGDCIDMPAPIISPDGEKIAFFVYLPNEGGMAVIADRHGTILHEGTPHPSDVLENTARFTPDSTHFVYGEIREAPTEIPGTGPAEVWWVVEQL